MLRDRNIQLLPQWWTIKGSWSRAHAFSHPISLFIVVTVIGIASHSISIYRLSTFQQQHNGFLSHIIEIPCAAVNRSLPSVHIVHLSIVSRRMRCILIVSQCFRVVSKGFNFSRYVLVFQILLILWSNVNTACSSKLCNKTNECIQITFKSSDPHNTDAKFIGFSNMWSNRRLANSIYRRVPQRHGSWSFGLM